MTPEEIIKILSLALGRELSPAALIEPPPAPGLVPVAYVARVKARAHVHEWKPTKHQTTNFENFGCDTCSAYCWRSSVADFLVYTSPRTRREVYVWPEVGD